MSNLTHIKKEKKQKNVPKNVVATISHGEYKDVFLNKTFFRAFDQQNPK